jgi:anti-anti-sigma factor
MTNSVIELKESLSYQNCEQVEAMLNDCIRQQKTEIILDFKNISFIDSAGLELLVRIDTELRSRGGLIKIIGLNHVCRDILIATRLINTFHIYEDIHEAIRVGL